MGLFGRKKKKDAEFFGGRIEPCCDYCLHSVAAAGDTKCLLNQMPVQGGAGCKRFAYDPLRREPHGTPRLGKYDAEDFKL